MTTTIPVTALLPVLLLLTGGQFYVGSSLQFFCAASAVSMTCDNRSPTSIHKYHNTSPEYAAIIMYDHILKPTAKYYDPPGALLEAKQ